jgi:hypothetical protein
LRGVNPRALAAFVKRPQAASSNRRYIHSIVAAFLTVNEKKNLYYWISVHVFAGL